MGGRLGKVKKKCIELMVEKGLDINDIALELGVDNKVIETWMADDIFRLSYEEALMNRIRFLGAWVLKKEEELIKKGGSSGLSAMKDILDRGGFKAAGKGGYQKANGFDYADDIPEDVP